MTSLFAQPKTFVAIPRLSGLATHPAGHVMVTRQELDSARKAYVHHAWAVKSVAGTDTVAQLTSGDSSVGSLCPMADGSVYFISTRSSPGNDEKRSRLWWMPSHGEARMVLDLPGGVDEVYCGGDRIFVLTGMLPSAFGSADEAAENQRLHDAREKSGVSAILYHTAPTRYWDQDISQELPTVWVADHATLSSGAQHGGRLRRVMLPSGFSGERAGGMSVAPDGSGLLVSVDARIPGNWQRGELWYVPVLPHGTGEPRKIQAADPMEWWDPGAISPDGHRAVVYRNVLWTPESNLAVSLRVVDLRTGGSVEVLAADDYWGQNAQWINDESFVCTSDFQGRGIVLRVDVPTDLEAEQPGVAVIAGGGGQDWTYTDVHVAGDQFWALRNRMDRAPELVHWAEGESEPTEVSGLVTNEVPSGRLEEITTSGADGTELRAWLALPEDEPGASPTQWPLLVFVHGGPWGSNNMWSWRWNAWPFVAAGYAVLFPDPAISTGYGQAMIDRGQQELGGAPFTDIMALVQAATERDDIHDTQQALLGGSYGGYMANWVAGHTQERFRCIVTHASLWDLNTMGTTTDNTEWQEAMAPQVNEYSPHLFVDRIQVPMLVIHGDKDYRVPMSQALQLWSDLQRKTDVQGHKFLYYPDEGHWILKPANARTWYETVLAFVNEHVKGESWQRPQLLG